MLRKLIIAVCLIFGLSVSYAIQDIDIVGGNNAGNPKVAVVNFSGDSQDNSGIATIIADDLSITGEFTVKRYQDASNVESGSVQYVITGSVNNDKSITFNLVSTTAKPAISLNQQITFNADTRKAAHTISNNIYKKITNVNGIFTTKIAYIINSGGSYQVIISDYDGYNPKEIFSSSSPITSLAWDASGRLISYVSFESGKAVVYVQDVYKAKRYKVADFTGSNSSPAFTPDGKSLAVTLSKDYGSHIYLVNNSSFTHNTVAKSLIGGFGSIDTEASFSNNGQMVFTSNHDGGPQIFLSNLQGVSPSRLTVNLGKYNTTARFSHDASKITFINRNGGVLKTYVMDLATKAAYPISLNTGLDLSPSFAPNDKLILYSSNGNGMYIGNTTGTIQTRLNKIVANSIVDQRWSNNF